MLSDGWTAVTRDRSLSAQFEHSVGVTDDRRRDLHAVAQGARQAALQGLNATVRDRRATRPEISRCGDCHPRDCIYEYAHLPAIGADGLIRMAEDRRMLSAKDGLAERGAALSRPSRTAARALPRRRPRRGQRLRIAGAGAVPRHAPARRQAAGQGADREVRLVRRSRLRAAPRGSREIEGHRRRRDHRDQDLQAAASRLARGEMKKRHGAVVLGERDRLLPHRAWRSPTRSNSASCFSTSATS